jgi:hypothetical protein
MDINVIFTGEQMILTGPEIKTAAIVQDGIERHYRPTTYDLTIGSIVNPEGTEVQHYTIPPQGLVKVVSAETIRMPHDKMGYVLVKTSLCNDGVLALNIGIVDPRYEGPLSSTLINFGKSSHSLTTGDVFSRLSIHDLQGKSPPGVHSAKTRADAIREAIKQVDEHLSNTFLDIEATAEKAAKKAFEGYKTLLWIYVPLAAILLAALTFGLNFGNMWGLYRYFYPQDMVRSSSLKEDMEKQLIRVIRQNEELAQKVERLEKKAQQRPAPNSQRK